MAKWVPNRAGVWEYNHLGFRAGPGQILDAVSAPDPYWSLNGDQEAAETVVRHVLGSPDLLDGGEAPAQMAILDHIDGGTATHTLSLDLDGGTP